MHNQVVQTVGSEQDKKWIGKKLDREQGRKTGCRGCFREQEETI